MNMTLHGGNPENLYGLMNVAEPDKILDFSTNTNILSWPDINLDVEKLASSYPDNECRKLRDFLSSKININLDRILFTNGINEAIFALSRIYIDNVGILQPCYTEYSRAFRNLHDVFNLNEAGNYGTFILSNPNNPTGKFTADLSLTIKKFPDTVFIVDEAYIDFLTNAEPERLCDFRNVIILRSMTKIFHLSGARIGYVIADENIISELKGHLPSWNVNSFAQELALYFLNDSKFYKRTRDFYRENVPLFVKNLRSSGFHVINSDVHYFLVRVNNDIKIIKYLLKNGIAVRHTRNFSGLDGKYIRVATRQPEENIYFVETIKKAALS